MSPVARVVLDIEAQPSDGDDQLRVAGSLQAGDGPAQGFVGWVGLIALLEAAVRGVSAEAPEGAGAGPEAVAP